MSTTEETNKFGKSLLGCNVSRERPCIARTIYVIKVFFRKGFGKFVKTFKFHIRCSPFIILGISSACKISIGEAVTNYKKNRMFHQKESGVRKMEEKKRDGFFKLYGISEEEEKFFKMIYRRRIVYRTIIALQAIVIAMLLLWK